ncbi:MAG: sigma-70 family RNA polymerase sigma factor [Gaiellaceae bacterium]
MARSNDPLADVARLVPRIYAYVAYRIGAGPDAEDVTSDVFERALRYRNAYDPSLGEPIGWLIGIARRCIDAAGRPSFPQSNGDLGAESAAGELEAESLRRLTVAAAVAQLDERDRDLIALRYGSDLSARQIGDLVGMKQNAVEVALHRARARLREELSPDD